MIQIRKHKDEDALSFETFIKENSLLSFSRETKELEFFIVEDNGSICGFSGYRSVGCIGEIHCIYISKSYRGLKFGDGLFRAVLNNFNLLGVSSVLVYANKETVDFVRAEGLLIKEETKKYTVFSVDLADFFNAPCKGH